MISADSVYGLLLRAYPTSFRTEFGTEMAQAFRDQRHEGNKSSLEFWWRMLSDIARSAPRLRLEALRARVGAASNFTEGKMKAMAILALLIGAVEAQTSVTEGWLGGVRMHDGASLVDSGFGLLAGLLLVVSAVAMLRRSRNAALLAQLSAVACLAIFVSMTLISRRFSMFSTILGISFPLALLLYFRIAGGRGRGMPTTASS
jgi:hypothetical protein